MSLSPFVTRHIGPSQADQRTMLNSIGMVSLNALLDQTIPADIRFTRALDIPEGIGEDAALDALRTIMADNIVAKAMIGQGYHGTHVPPVIQRNLFENPGWYTSYTPYQPEISQGRLEMLFNFQTLVSELTGLPVSNASLLDEATAVAEAAGMALRHHRGKRTGIVLANALHPQSVDVLNTRASTLGLDIYEAGSAIDESVAAVIIQMPDTFGEIIDPGEIVARAQRQGEIRGLRDIRPFKLEQIIYPVDGFAAEIERIARGQPRQG